MKKVIFHYLFMILLSKTLEEHEHILMCSFFCDISSRHTVNITMAAEALEKHPEFFQDSSTGNQVQTDETLAFFYLFHNKRFRNTISKIFGLLLFHFVCCSRGGHHNASDFPCRVPALCWVILTRLTFAKTES